MLIINLPNNDTAHLVSVCQELRVSHLLIQGQGLI